MHPFPPTDDLQCLVGAEIGQIALDPWSIQFRFTNGGQITVEGAIEYVDETGTSHKHDCRARTGAALYLHQLIEHCISGVDPERFCLTLTFDNGALLRILSDDGPYECGQIHSVGKPLIVF